MKSGWIILGLVAAFGIGAMAWDLGDTDKLKQVVQIPSVIGTPEQGFSQRTLTPYFVDMTNAALIYMRYSSGSGNILIVRITTTSTSVAYEKAVTSWTARATATYTPIND
jgi:hypothetical protein